MSKTSVRSKARTYKEEELHFKPFGFCCSVDKFDPLAKYDQKNPPYESSLQSISLVNGSPVLKFQTNFDDDIKLSSTKQKDIKQSGSKESGTKQSSRKESGTKQSSIKESGTKHSNIKESGTKQSGIKESGIQQSSVKYSNIKQSSDTKLTREFRKNNPRSKQTVNLRNIRNYNDDSLDSSDLQNDNGLYALQKPLQWYIEDEITVAKDMLWEQRQEAYNEEANRNAIIGRRKSRIRLKKMSNMKYPRWYQDFSINQMKDLMALGDIIQKDYEEMVTGRTQRILISIGIASTFFKVTAKDIKRLQEFCNDNVLEFLREIYKILTGDYFENEGYKKFYDCNERIILSAIAFLTFPEAVVELNKRLPPVIMPKLPPKPIPPKCPLRKKMSSPYKEDLFTMPDWASYINSLDIWRKHCQTIPIPKVILPPKECILNSQNVSLVNNENNENKQNITQRQALRSKDNNKEEKIVMKEHNKDKVKSTKIREGEPGIDTIVKKTAEVKDSLKPANFESPGPRNSNLADSRNPNLSKPRNSNSPGPRNFDSLGQTNLDSLEPTNFDTPEVPNDTQEVGKETKVYDFTLNGLSEKPGPVEYKICGTLNPPRPIKKSWLGEKDAHYVISGAPDNPPSCPITYELSGIANVTPTNSDERFFAVLKLGDETKKIYPRGREHLSKNWQEWLQNVDEEFKKVERETNKMIKDIQATMRLVFPEPTCDSCCSCRQTRKTHIKLRETKAPYFVIDTLAVDGEDNKYIVGSMAMHSPAPTPPESTVNLLEIIASEDVIKSNVVINGMTNDKGEKQYFISGFRKDIIHVPSRVVERPPPTPLRNVPPCVCAVQQIFNKGLSPTLSHDNIPWTKDEGLCFGKKYRPDESPAYSCKKYPGDKSCRRNPFMHEIVKMKRKQERERLEAQKVQTDSKDKVMYSIADFPPCGDEHGMALCGGPWGTLNLLTKEELEEQEKLRKEILRGPPCGTKPGRAVCEGPFGERIPLKKPKVEVGEEEIIGEDDEEDVEDEEEEEGKKKEEVPVEKEKVRHRQKECYMSPESIAGRTKVVEKKVGKFIPDPNYHGYDDPWNVFRTAPSEKESVTEYEKSLALTVPQSPSIPKEVKTELKETVSKTEQIEKPPAKKDTTRPTTPKDRPRTSSKDSKKKIDSGKQKISEQTLSKPVTPESSDTKKKSVEKEKKDYGDRKEEYESSKMRKNQELASSETKRSQEPTSPKVRKSQEHAPSKIGKGKDFNKTGEGIRKRSSLLKKNIPSHQKGFNISSNIETTKPEKGFKGPTTTKIADVNEKTVDRAARVEKHFKPNVSNVETEQRSKKEKDKFSAPVRDLSSTVGVKRKSKSIERNISKSPKRDKKKDVRATSEVDPVELRHNQIERIKTMMMSSENYPHDVEPVVLPEEVRKPCKHEYEEAEESKTSVKVEDDADVQLSSRGPCGWRTKSEQELPTKKNLIYITEPDYPMETIPVRPGGRPCVCRENRAKKKTLLYNIGGLLNGKKESLETSKLFKKRKEEEKKTQLIEGVIYYTPPLSPRRSDEYVPEYDLIDSPYDMCLSQRKDEDLKLLEQHTGAKSLVSKALKNVEPCSCNEFVDTFGLSDPDQEQETKKMIQECDKVNQQLIEAKPPKERWSIALRDAALVDYFSRCRDSLPCWLKCAKFNKDGCSIRTPKLKTKRPVCECKYERKILEHKEEKMKWKNRQKKLKSLTKQPFLNVVDTSRPVEPDTKLMISDVKRIPRNDEYIDDIKYCITGVAENYTMAPPMQVVDGLKMITPIQTPEPSKPKIPDFSLHRHWSPTKIPPGPLPRRDEALIAEKKRRQEILDKAIQEIYAPPEVYDTHIHGCEETCGIKSTAGTDEIEAEESIVEEGNSRKEYSSSKRKKQELKSMGPKKQQTNISDTKKLDNTSKDQSNISDMKKLGSTSKGQSSVNDMKRERSPDTTVKSIYKRNKDSVNEESRTKVLRSSRKQEYKKNEGETRQQHALTDKTKDKEVVPSDITDDEDIEETDEISSIAKIELKKMAEEGFLFAKLPKCFSVPQLQYWLMYREGVVFTDADKRNLMRNSRQIWDLMGAEKWPTIKAPSLHLKKRELENLTYDDAEKMKKKIAENKEIFHSELRKARVMYARSMWDTMEYGKFPSKSFKEAYFTYLAGKEADGHVFKPWVPSEVNEMT